MSYDEAVIALYQAPVSSFIAERKRLAGELRDAGDKAGAAKLGKLAKPTLSAWVVNQLYWHARDAYDQMMATADRLRAGDLSASAAHRESIANLRARAARILTDGGHGAPEATLRRVATTLAAVAASGGFAPDPPGALAEDRDPVGFEVAAALAQVPVRPAARVEAEEEEPPAEPEDELPAEDEAERRAVLQRRLDEEAAEREAKRTAEAKHRVDEAHRHADAQAKHRADEDKRHDEAPHEAEAQRRAEDAKREAEAKRGADETNRDAEAKHRAGDEAKHRADDEAKRRGDEAKREAEARRHSEAEAKQHAEDETKRRADEAKREAEARRREEAEAKRRADEARAKTAAERSKLLAGLATARGELANRERAVAALSDQLEAAENKVAEVRELIAMFEAKLAEHDQDSPRG